MFLTRQFLLIITTSLLKGFLLFSSSSYAQEEDIDQASNEINLETLLTSISNEGPTPCPQSPSIVGYSNITQLVIDLALTQLFNPLPATFTVCPNTIYNITTELEIDNEDYHLPIVVPFDDITINCGVDGNVNNECIFTGGYAHAILGGKNSTLNGFTFKDSIGVSVVTAGPTDFSAQFNNCIWEGNKGYGLLFNQMLFRSILEVVMDTDSLMKLLPTTPDLAGLPPSLGEGMTVSFEACQFLENDVEIALMYNNHSSVVINNSLFEKNSAKVADIIIQNDSQGIISNTCFSEEKNQALGIVYVSSDSTLIQEGVSSFSSATKTSACNDIFKETTTSICLTNSTECMDVKSCEDFISTDITSCKHKTLASDPAPSNVANAHEDPSPEASAPGSSASSIVTKYHTLVTFIPLAFACLIL